MGTAAISLCSTFAQSVETALSKARQKHKNNKYERHHIVAKNAAAAREARALLNHKKVRINVNSSLNIVAIKYNLHKHLHTKAYHYAVYKELSKVKGNYKGTVRVLNYFRAVLLAASKRTP